MVEHPVDGIFVVSIHAPREGCDVSDALERSLRNAFQSTHPVRGATIS